MLLSVNLLHICWKLRDGKADEYLIQSLINQIFLLFPDAYHPAQDPEVMPQFAEIFMNVVWMFTTHFQQRMGRESLL